MGEDSFGAVLRFTLLILLLSGVLVGCSADTSEVLLVRNQALKEIGVQEKVVRAKSVDLVHQGKIVSKVSPSTDFDSEESYKDYLVSIAKELARGKNGFDQPMKNPKLLEDGTITAGKPRVILKESELVEALVSSTFHIDRVDLPIYVTNPSFTEQDLIGIDERVISTFKTYFNSSIRGRTHNIVLSAKAIDGVILGPNDIFSFNEVVGERTRERGYQEASVILDGDFVDGLGGGVCQTSSTLYNTVLEAQGFKVIERNPHTLPVGYVPKGRDAMVSWGWSDLKFQNDNNYPIIIRAKVEGSSIIIEFRTAARYVSF